MSIQSGQSLLHYRIVGKIGEGGMGVVWKAVDTTLDREVALKILPDAFAGDPGRLTRFKREAKVLASLNHSNIATIYGLHEAAGLFFLAMELVKGEDLAQRFARERLQPADALDAAQQIAEALQAAHQSGVIHRDLKPANIMITPQGSVKVLDFGLAKRAEFGSTPDDATRTSTDSRAGAILGTVAYMSPEQARGRPLDPRTDIWSFGCVVHEALTGKPAFRGDTAADTLAAVLTSEPAWGALPPEIPETIVELLHSCLNKDANRRPGDMSAVLAELKQARAKGPSGLTSARSRTDLKTSLVVLPFINMTADPENEYFSDGLTEDLINALSRIRDLRVAARTSSFVFKSRQADTEEIRKKLGVEIALHGSVRRAGNRLRVTAEVVSLADGFQLWSDRYDRTLDDIFLIQDEITAAIVRSLKVELLKTPPRAAGEHGATRFDAYNECLKGRYCLNRRITEDLLRSVRFFERALELDPRYAPAYSGLADSYNVLGAGDYAVLAPSEAFPKAKQAAARALEIDPSLAEAHTALGWAKTVYDWDWDGGERDYLLALELNHGYATAHHWYGLHLALRGRFDEALAEMDTASQLDPLSPIVNSDVAWVLHRARRYDEAIAQCRHTLELDPDFSVAHWNLGQSLREKGMLGDAVVEFERAEKLSSGNLVFRATLAHALALSGERDRAMEILEEFKRRSRTQFVAPHAMVLIHIGLGDREQALNWLERTYKHRSDFVIEANVDPVLDPLRDDDRFRELMHRLDFPER